MEVSIAFTIIYFLPTFFVVIKNLLWAIYLWQIKDYKTFRLLDYLRLDAEPGLKDEFFRITPLILLLPIILFIFKPEHTFLIFTSFLIFVFYVF